jgi:two-component sensor histidine kinase
MINASLEPAATSLAIARGFVVSLLNGKASAEFRSRVQSVTNELVSNAIVHGSLDHEIRLVLEVHGNDVDVSVHNVRRQVEMSNTVSDAHDGGRGLRIVAALAQRWGIESGETGTTVTATIST